MFSKQLSHIYSKFHMMMTSIMEPEVETHLYASLIAIHLNEVALH